VEELMLVVLLINVAISPSGLGLAHTF